MGRLDTIVADVRTGHRFPGTSADNVGRSCARVRRTLQPATRWAR